METVCRDLLDQLAEDFLQSPLEEDLALPEETKSSWRRHYQTTLEGLRTRGAELGAPGREGEDAYIEKRKSWHPEIAALCADMAFPVGEVLGSLGQKAPPGRA